METSNHGDRIETSTRPLALILNGLLIIFGLSVASMLPRLLSDSAGGTASAFPIVMLLWLGVGTARYQLARGRRTTAVVMLSGGFFAITLLAPLMLKKPTDGNEYYLVLPLIAVCMGLPYIQERPLKAQLIAAWLVTLGGVLINISKGKPLSALPEALGLTLMMGLLYYLLWLFKRQIMVALGQERRSNRQLQQTQDELNNNIEELQGLRQQLQAQLTQAQSATRELELARGELEQRVAAEIAAQQELQGLRQVEQERHAELARSVESYRSFAQHVAAGDLTRRLEVRGSDTLGQLEVGLNGMVESLQSITRQVQGASANIARMTTEILAATTQQASGAAEQSAALTQTTSTVQEVKTIAQQTAEQAAQIAHKSQAAIQVAQTGAQSIGEMVEGMTHIRQQVQGIASTILALSEQTQAIGTIIQTVNELADQSNLLALNAAIEAARAGEQGKSFAVVAQQVRNLAERSKAATAQVREILGEIQQATNAAVMVTEEGTKGVEVGVQLAGQAGHMIQRIADEVKGAAQANVQMAAAADQQMAGIQQIGHAMQSIQQATGQSVGATRQAERAARELNALSQALQQAVSSYRV